MKTFDQVISYRTCVEAEHTILLLFFLRFQNCSIYIVSIAEVIRTLPVPFSFLRCTDARFGLSCPYVT